MSGGHYGYAYEHLDRLVEAIEAELAEEVSCAAQVKSRARAVLPMVLRGPPPPLLLPPRPRARARCAL
jgi:hypothetical protein